MPLCSASFVINKREKSFFRKQAVVYYLPVLLQHPKFLIKCLCLLVLSRWPTFFGRSRRISRNFWLRNESTFPFSPDNSLFTEIWTDAQVLWLIILAKTRPLFFCLIIILHWVRQENRIIYFFSSQIYFIISI